MALIGFFCFLTDYWCPSLRPSTILSVTSCQICWMEASYNSSASWSVCLLDVDYKTEEHTSSPPEIQMVFLRALGLVCRSVYHIHIPVLKLMSEVFLIPIIVGNGCSFWFFTEFQSFASFLEQVQSFSLIATVCHATALVNWERQGVPLYIWKPSIRIRT